MTKNQIFLTFCCGQVRNGLAVVTDVFVALKCAVEHAITSLSERYELHYHPCFFAQYKEYKALLPGNVLGLTDSNVTDVALCCYTLYTLFQDFGAVCGRW